MPTTEPDQFPLTVIDRLTLALLAAVMLFAPLALGAVQPWSEQIFLIIAAAIAVLTAVRFLLQPGAIPLRWWTVAPLIGFPLLVGLQLLPWAGLLKLISPQSIAIRNEMLAPFVGSDAALSGATISLYAEETYRHFRLLLGVIAVFIGATAVIRSRGAVRFLLNTMMCAGLMVALIGTAHGLLGIQKIYGVIARPPLTSETTAPFINRNHFAQFLNMSIGASMALLLGVVSAAVQTHSPRRGRDWIELAQQGMLHAGVVPLFAIIICSTAVVMSGSRGGALALVVASLFTAVAASRRKSARLVTGGFAVMLVLMGAAAFTFSARLQERINALSQQEADGGRLELLRGQAQIWRAFPATGVGLGTFEYVFPRYDRTKPINIASHAENDYAQLLTETGAAGLALAICFLVAIWIAYGTAVRRGGRSGLVALGLGFGLAAVMIQSAFDFGQRLPANATMTAVAVAILLRVSWARPNPEAVSPRLPARVAAGVSVIALAGTLVWLVFQADAHRHATAAVKDSSAIADQLSSAAGQGTSAQYGTMMDAARRAVAVRPGNVAAHYALGFAEYWSWMRQRQARFDPAADQAAVEQILQRFDRAMVLAPLHGPPYSMAGQIRLSMGDADVGNALIRRAVELSPQDGWSALLAGELSVQQGKDDEAIDLFRRAAATSGIDQGYVLRRLINVYDRLDLAYRFAGDNRYLNEEILNELRRQNRLAEGGLANERILAAVLREADQSSASPGALARAAELLRQKGREDESISYLRRGVALDPSKVDWRFELSRSLFKLDDLRGAEDEIRAVLRDRPDWPQARELAAAIRLRTTTQPFR